MEVNVLFTRVQLFVLVFSLSIPYSLNANAVTICKEKFNCLKNNKEECIRLSGWGALATICGIASVTAAVGGICFAVQIIQKKFSNNEMAHLNSSTFDSTKKPPKWLLAALGLIIAGGLGYASWKASLKTKEKWNKIMDKKK